MKTSKLKIALQNSAWQTLPMVSTLLLSLVVVKWFSFSLWGNIISILVVQQIVNGILAWGNKDYLQRELSINPSAFSTDFTQLFLERFLLFVIMVSGVYYLGLLDNLYFTSFLLIVFGRFVNQSFDVIIIKQRKFSLTLFLDSLVLAIQLGSLFFIRHNNLVSLDVLLSIFWIPLLLKSGWLIVVFWDNFRKPLFKKLMLRNSVFFGLLAISGLVHSKIDIFIVSRILDIEKLGKYQIVMSFLWCIQSASLLISGPFVHNFYRLDKMGQRNSSKLLKNIGFAIVPSGVLLAMTLLFFVYKIEVNISIILASLLFSMASFIYLPWIFQINQKNEEYRVLIVNVIGTLLLIGLLLIANRISVLTLETTLWVVALHQILITLMVFIANKKPSYAT